MAELRRKETLISKMFYKMTVAKIEKCRNCVELSKKAVICQLVNQ